MRCAQVILALMLLVALVSQASAERALKDYEDYAGDYSDEECNSWDYDWEINYRYVGGTSSGTAAAASAAKCADMCIEEDACYTFNFYKRKCYMFEDNSDDLTLKYAKGQLPASPTPAKMRFSHVILAVMVLVALTSQVLAERTLTDYQDYEDCNTWDYDWDTNTRWYGGTSAGVTPCASAAKCGDLCIESDTCYTFNFYKRKCYMYEEHEEGASSKYGRGYTAGYIFCADKKK